jgi:NDP-sugar pyrophosphorylase family protein
MSRRPHITILVPMAGTGQRFRAAGYETPKFALQAGGRTLMNWSLASLAALFERGRFLFAFCEEDNQDGRVADLISAECSSLGVSEVKLISLTRRTGGQAETAFLGLAEETSEAPLFVWNIDTYVESRALIGIGNSDQNAVYCFECSQDRPYSWVRKDESHGYTLEVREKKKISNYASLGLYEFATTGLFRHAYLTTYGTRPSGSVGELYVAPLYNELIRGGIPVNAPVVDASAVHILGTPKEYEEWRMHCAADIHSAVW